MKIKTLQQIQEENRKFIIMANNRSAETYEEALEMELLDQIPCLVKIKYNRDENEYDRLIFYTLQNEDGQELVEMGGGRIPRKRVSRVVGGLLTLNRVLIALGEDFCFYKENKTTLSIAKINQDPDSQIKWDLTKETLEEQSEKVQREFNKLIIDEI
jgi:hypothetical protein